MADFMACCCASEDQSGRYGRLFKLGRIFNVVSNYILQGAVFKSTEPLIPPVTCPFQLGTDDVQTMHHKLSKDVSKS